MVTLAANLAKAEPATNEHISIRVFAASRAKFWPAYGNAVTQSLALFSEAAALALLLACCNISNLLVERALGRRGEIAIRLSLGASRGRVFCQLMTDSLGAGGANPGCLAGLRRAVSSFVVASTKSF
ncbi:MAG TPA: FtsX-like permease family protein [Bryobacteraceae bacterium]|nr:FtsX-like permease family protein [Bryobacteraceae bacterium]